MANVNNSENATLIVGTADADNIHNTGNNVTVEASDGDDSVFNYGEHVTITATLGNNYVQNGEAGQYSENGFYAYIVTGDGDDTIKNHGRYSTIDAGDGNDSIRTDVYGLHGSSDYRDVTVFGGAGDDTLEVNDNETSLNGGAGNDVISVQGGRGSWSTNTLQGGTGDDTIYGGNKNVFFYTEGDGYDVIYNYVEDDTIQINSAVASLSMSGNDSRVAHTPWANVATADDTVILIGNGGMLLKNYVGKINVSYGYVVNVNLTDLGETADGVFVITSSTTAGGDLIILTDATFKETAAADDIIVGYVSPGKVYVADSNENKLNRQNITLNDNWSVMATAYDDTLNVQGNNATVAGLSGNDIISLGSDVTSAVIADLDTTEDALAFAKIVQEKTLVPTASASYLSLGSAAMNLLLTDYSALTTDLLDYSVDNAGTPNTIRELLYVREVPTITAVNIDLSWRGVPDDSTSGVFIVETVTGATGNVSLASDTATFKAAADADDFIVGSVSGKIYNAVTDSPWKQIVSVSDDWTVSGTQNDDTFNVYGQSAAVSGGAGADNISIGSDALGVTIVDVAELGNGTDKLSFELDVELGSLRHATTSAGFYLYNLDKDIAFMLAGISVLEDELLDATVDNAGASNTIRELLYDAPLITSVDVDLSEADDAAGVFVVEVDTDVKGNLLLASDTATFKAAADADDFIVGSVSGKIYNAVTDSPWKQIISVADAWTVNATQNDDTFKVSGSDAAISGGAGADNISVGRGARNLTIVDVAELGNGTDKLSFATQIGLGTLKQETTSAGIYLYNEDVSFTLAGISVLEDELLDATVDNAGASNAIRELLYVEPVLDAVNVDLSWRGVPDDSTSGVFIVETVTSAAGELSLASDTATFKAAADADDFIVGSVSGKIYNAVTDSPWKQIISVADAWTVNATQNDDTFKVSGSDAAISGGAGADNISIGSDALGVTIVDVAELGNGTDKLSFSTQIGLGTLKQETTSAGISLYNEDVSFTLAEVSELDDNLLSCKVGNAGAINTLGELLYVEPEDLGITAIKIDLNEESVPDGFFVVEVAVNSAGELLAQSDTATFKMATETGDFIVGYVTDDNVYKAVVDSPWKQIISVPDAWTVNGTQNDDTFKVSGSDAAISGGAGADNISIGGGVLGTTLVDVAELRDGADKLSFATRIGLGTLKQETTAAGISLGNDDVSFTLAGISALDDDLLSCEVGNAGATNTIRELLYEEPMVTPDEPSDIPVINPDNLTGTIRLAQWSYGFEPPEDFTFYAQSRDSN